MRAGRWLWLMAVCLVAFSRLGMAQSGATSAAIQGSVIDSTGGAVVGAAVVIRNETTGETAAVVTDGSGHYSMTPAAPGLYTIEVTQSGFAQQRRERLQLQAGQTLTVDIRLGVATVTEEVTVAGKIPEAARLAPSQGSLTARSAQSIIGQDFIDKFTSPVADYTQVL